MAISYKQFAYIFIILCGWFFAGLAYAEPLASLRCGTTEFAPYTFKKGDKIVGIEVDFLQEIAKRLNIKISLELRPWARLLKESEEGKFDCLYAPFKTEDRVKYLDFTRMPLHVTSLVFYMHRERPVEFSTIRDLEGLKISLLRGFKTSPEFDDARAVNSFRVVDSKSVEQSFLQLDAGRVDLVLYNHHVGAFTLKKMGLKDIVASSAPLTSNPSYLAFSKKNNHAHLIPKFDAVIFEILSDGTYQKILKEYIF